MTFLGAVVRHLDGWMPVAAAVDLMAPLGLGGPSVRTTISRLKKRGWLEPETKFGVRGYTLTTKAVEILAAGDEIIWHSRNAAPLREGWCIIHFSIPESARRRRHQLRSHLTALGFGNVGTALWIAPARMLEAGERAIGELELTQYSAIFVGQYAAGQPLKALISQSWDLDHINRGYRTFIQAFSGLATKPSGADGIDLPEAFVTYIELVDSWRRLPFRDPGIPTELLAKQGDGARAGALFEQLVEQLGPPALAHASTRWPSYSDARRPK